MTRVEAIKRLQEFVGGFAQYEASDQADADQMWEEANDALKVLGITAEEIAAAEASHV